MVRSLIAIFAGYLLMALGLVGLFALVSGETSVTPGFLAIASLCNLALATASGYVTALLAHEAPMIHGLALVGLASGMWIVSAAATGQEPLVFQWVNLAMTALGVLTGAYWRAWQQQAIAKG
ncbi:MAG: hypothetical protein HC857_08660 [Synechococcales cyanobacterium RU_4_20]|nr:hypothetical protein [Synechococcales cyanobacterium RU_4_20]NJR68887.1 hypothetical protein [Synechococcales cyanobacterium CRU_2_2]